MNQCILQVGGALVLEAVTRCKLLLHRVNRPGVLIGKGFQPCIMLFFQCGKVEDVSAFLFAIDGGLGEAREFLRVSECPLVLLAEGSDRMLRMAGGIGMFVGAIVFRSSVGGLGYGYGTHGARDILWQEADLRVRNRW